AGRDRRVHTRGTDRVDVPPDERQRNARPSESGRTSPERSHRRERRLPAPRRVHRSRHQDHRLAVRSDGPAGHRSRPAQHSRRVRSAALGQLHSAASANGLTPAHDGPTAQARQATGTDRPYRRAVRKRLLIGVLATSFLLSCSTAAHDHAVAPRSAATTSTSLRRPPAIRAARSPAREPVGRTVVATLVSNDIDRTYRLHTPPLPATATRVPLVVVLHGANGNAGRVEVRYHWDTLSDRMGFVV